MSDTSLFAPTTPIRIDILVKELRNHPDREFVSKLETGLRHGFHTGVNALPTETYKCKNLRSCLKETDFISSAIEDELNKGYLIGPYTADTCPFPTIRINPIGCVEGKYSKKKRIILDLSSPHDMPGHESVNSLISKEDISLSYVRLDDAIAIINCLGPGSMMSKFDIQDAFKLLPVSPSLWHLQGLEWDNKMYFYTRLCFGSRSSPYLFTLLSEAVHFIATQNYGVHNLLFLLDDFLTIDISAIMGKRSMAIMTMIFNRLGIPLSHHKTAGPSEVIEYLGIPLDTLRMEARLPPVKLCRLRDLLAAYKTKDKCTKRELLSLLGHLCYAARVMPVGRAFVARLLAAAKLANKLWDIVILSDDCKADIDMWLCIVQKWNGISLFLDTTYTNIQTINVTTDSSRRGFGGYNKTTGHFFMGEWKDYLPHLDIEQCSMALLELYPIVLSAHLWGDQWSRKRIMYHCDNQSTMHILNAKRSRCPIIMKLIRKFTIDAA